MASSKLKLVGRYLAWGPDVRRGLLVRGGDEGRKTLVRVLPETKASPENLARLRGEASQLARIRHQNVLRVEHVTAVGGKAALVLEPFDGASLAKVQLELAKRKQRVPMRAALELAAAVATAVDAVTARPPSDKGRFVHAGLQPSEILVDALGRVKVAGFGLWKEGDPPLRAQKGYSPPEGSGEPAGAAYSVGALLLELITGREPPPCSKDKEGHEVVLRSAATRIVTCAGEGGWEEPVRIVRTAMGFEAGQRTPLGALARELRTCALRQQTPGLRAWAPASVSSILEDLTAHEKPAQAPPPGQPSKPPVARQPVKKIQVPRARLTVGALPERDDDFEDRPTTVAPFPEDLLDAEAMEKTVVDPRPLAADLAAEEEPTAKELEPPPDDAPPAETEELEPGPTESAPASDVDIGAVAPERPDDFGPYDETEKRRRSPLRVILPLGLLATLLLLLVLAIWKLVLPAVQLLASQIGVEEPGPAVAELLEEDGASDEAPVPGDEDIPAGQGDDEALVDVEEPQEGDPEGEPDGEPDGEPAHQADDEPQPGGDDEPRQDDGVAATEPDGEPGGEPDDEPEGEPAPASDAAGSDERATAVEAIRTQQSGEAADQQPEEQPATQQSGATTEAESSSSTPAGTDDAASESSQAQDTKEIVVVEAQPQPVTGSFRVEFRVDDADIFKLEVRCHQGSATGRSPVILNDAGKGPCRVTATTKGGEKYVAWVGLTGPGTYTCFVNGQRRCE